MGLGDQLMATGLARGAKARGKRIAFGDKHKIIWDHHSEQVFRGNPNIAAPGSEKHPDIEWVPFYRGNRTYNRQAGDKWVWNYNFHATPGEVFLTEDERRLASFLVGKTDGPLVLIEPNLPTFKQASVNKQWPIARYQEVAKELKQRGYHVAQFAHGGKVVLSHAKQVATPSFRHALAVLERAALYVGPEGGLHHGAAAVSAAAVVLFGGFIPPAVTGYAAHTNLTGGAEACGSLIACQHCRDALENIGVSDVLGAAERHLKLRAA